MADESDWKTRMRKHLGKSLQKHYDNIMLDIILISIGIKPSLLFDYWCIDPMKVFDLLEDLHQSGMTVSLDVVVLGQDFFITNLNNLLTILKENLKLRSFALIDVSGNLDQPRTASEEIRSRVCKQLDDLINQLEEKSCIPECFYNVEVQQDWNLATMFGFLLCYPVIYWFESECQSNCLSHVPLVLHRAYIKVPFHVNHGFFEKTFKEFPKSSDLKLLYSFSFPQQLNSFVEIHVQNWTKFVQRKALDAGVVDQVVFDETQIVRKEVIL